MIKVHCKYCLSILFFFLFVKGFTQIAVSSNSVKANFHYGAILPHKPEVNEIVEGHTQAYEFSFYKSTIGKKVWQQLYHYPRLGISALAMNLGNEEELGMGYGVFPFIDLPLSRKKANFRLKLGYGLGYIENPFDRESNFKNIAIGSHFNALVYANAGWSIKLIDAISISAGVSLIHFSNGSFSRPNSGINIFSLNTGVSYNFGKKKEKIVEKLEERPRKWSKKIMLGIGLKEIEPADGPKYFVSSYSFNFIKIRAEKSSFGFGTDLFYNTSLSELIASDISNTSNRPSKLDHFRLGLAGIYSFDFGKVSLLVEMGAYVFSKHKGNGLIYNKVETRVNVTDKLFLKLGIKTHFVVADFVELGIGYNFN